MNKMRGSKDHNSRYEIRRSIVWGISLWITILFDSPFEYQVKFQEIVWIEGMESCKGVLKLLYKHDFRFYFKESWFLIEFLIFSNFHYTTVSLFFLKEHFLTLKILNQNYLLVPNWVGFFFLHLSWYLQTVDGGNFYFSFKIKWSRD